jgi:hypothetical protein
MEIKQISRQNSKPVFTLTDTEKTPAEIDLKFEGYEKKMTAYIRIYTSEDGRIDIFEIDSVIMQLLRGLVNAESYIVKIETANGDVVTAENSLSDPEIVTDIYEWAQTAV